MQEKLSLLTELIKLARAEDGVKEEEFLFLDQVAKRLGVGEDEFKALFDKYIDFTPPELETERILQFHRLVLLMNVDGDADDDEIMFIKNVGLKMGLRPNAISAALAESFKHKDGVVPPEKLIEIFRTYNN